MSIRTLFIILLLTQSTTAAEFPSLFFSPDEMVLPQEPQEPLVLSAILYTDPTHWTVWINDAVIRPDTAHARQDFQVEAVTPSSVTVSRSPFNAEKIILTLQKE